MIHEGKIRSDKFECHEGILARLERCISSKCNMFGFSKGIWLGSQSKGYIATDELMVFGDNVSAETED